MYCDMWSCTYVVGLVLVFTLGQSLWAHMVLSFSLRAVWCVHLVCRLSFLSMPFVFNCVPSVVPQCMPYIVPHTPAGFAIVVQCWDFAVVPP
eukprot:14188336-Alexandrium_andersonii.AAC.1